MQELFQDHEKRISTLELRNEEFSKRLTSIENTQLKLESTLMRESGEQKGLLRDILSHQQKMEERKLDAELTREERIAIATQAKEIREAEERQVKSAKRYELFFKLASAGGLIYLIAESVMSK